MNPYINILDVHIESMEISLRTYLCLLKARITTIGELVSKKELQLLKLKNFDTSSLTELNKILNRFDLKFGMNENDINSISKVNLMDSEILRISKDELDLSVRTHNCLEAAGIETIGELVTKEESHMLRYKNFGRKSLTELNEKFSELNLKFGMNEFEILLFIASTDKSSLQYKKLKESAFTGARVKDTIFPVVIPPEFHNIPMEKLFLFSGNCNLKESFGTVQRILNAFSFFVDFNGFTETDFLKTKNFGRKCLTLLNTLLTNFIFHIKYSRVKEELLDKLVEGHKLIDAHTDSFSSNSLNDSLSDVCIKFLSKHSIPISLHSLDLIDNIIEDEKIVLNEEDLICLLEIRSIHFVPTEKSKKLSTYLCSDQRINHFAHNIDSFVNNNLKESNKSLIEYLYESNKTMEECGKKFGMTRERVRQIRFKSVNYFNMMYVPYSTSLISYFLSVISHDLRSINLGDIKSTEELVYGEGLYFDFIEMLFPHIPLNTNINKSIERNKTIKYLIDSDYKSLDNDITIGYIYSSVFNNSAKGSFNLSSFINDQSDTFKILAIRFAISFTESKFRIFENEKESNSILLLPHPSKLNLQQLAKLYLENLKSPAHIEEVAKYIENTLEKKCNSKSLMSRLYSDEYVIFFNRYEVGLQKHLNYSSDEIDDIVLLCYEIIKKIGHQVSAIVLFEEISDDYYKLHSKYELIHYLKLSDKLVYVGMRTFTLPKFGQDKRLLIKELVENEFKIDSNPKNVKDLHNKISQKRTTHVMGIRTILNQEMYQNYKASYYGVKSLHKKNLEYLLCDLIYVEKYMEYSSPNTSLDDILEELMIGNLIDKKEIIYFFTKSENIKFINNYFIYAKWNYRNFIKCIVRNSNGIKLNDIYGLIVENSIKVTEYKTIEFLTDCKNIIKDETDNFVYNEIL